MKNSLFIFLVSSMVSVFAQQPTVETPTMIPPSPTPADVVKIVTKVTTAYQSIIVDMPSATITNSPNAIKIKSCYSQMMLPATQTHSDTLVLGQLQPGAYTISHTAYLSSTQQHCTKIDSNMAVTSFTVSGSVAIKEINQKSFTVFPNPVKDYLYIENAHNFITAEIYSGASTLLKTLEVRNYNAINVHDLPAGVYFIIFRSDNNTAFRRFVKVE